MTKNLVLLLVLAAPLVAAAEDDRGRLSGRAYLGRGDYVVGGSVLVRPQDDASALYLTTSDHRGQFRAEGLADGLYVVDVERVGLETVVKTGIEVRHPFRAIVDLPMGPGRGTPPAERRTAGSTEALSFDVSVRDEKGTPVGEARVRLVRPDGGADPIEHSSGSDGALSIEGVPSGLWRIEASAVGFLPLRKHVSLSDDAAIRIAMTRQPADYDPSPLELMPLEEPLVPAVLDERTAK